MIGAPIFKTFGRQAVYLLGLPTVATSLAESIQTLLMC